jgi:hypothetical protein
MKARLAAARLDPPPYVLAELGRRPEDPGERRAWDRGVDQIEGWRAEHGIRDRDNALGSPTGSEHEDRRLRDQRRILERQQRLLREVAERVRQIEADRGFSIER